jgi:Putative prokaryotic signal transducing protein
LSGVSCSIGRAGPIKAKRFAYLWLPALVKLRARASRPLLCEGDTPPGDREPARIDAVAEELAVKEILRTNDAVLVSAVEALLAGANIPYLVLDQNMSVLEGSLGILPRRVLVEEGCLKSARRLLEDAGLARELRSDVG